MRQLISDISGIPIDNVEYAKLNGTFPRTLSVLTVHNNLTWLASSTTVDKWPLNIAHDGNIFYYRFDLITQRLTKKTFLKKNLFIH